MALHRVDLRSFLPPRALVGMVHVAALPCTPASSLSIDAIAQLAVQDALVLARAGFDAVMLENMHDRPYVNSPHAPHTTAAMARVALAVADALDHARTSKPLGLQILSRGEREALAIALAVGARFVRCENFALAHVADEGLMPDACAGPLLRYRRELGCDRGSAAVALLADVKKKHASHAITADIDIEHTVEACVFFGADAVIVTGRVTSDPPTQDDLARARAAAGTLPVLVGSGADHSNLGRIFEHADAAIVGSSVKHQGSWDQPVDPQRAIELVRARDARS